MSEVLHLSVPDEGSVPNAGTGTVYVSGSVTVVSDGQKVTGTMTTGGPGNAEIGLPGSIQIPTSFQGNLTGTISGPASSPVVDGTLHGTDDSGNDNTSPFHAGLHLTRIGCTAISGDLVALFQEITAPVSAYLTLGGSIIWTANRK